MTGLDPKDFAPPVGDLEPVGRRALAVGLVAAAVCVVGGLRDPAQFFRSWLVGWVLVLGVTLGSFAIGMLHIMSRGAWGLVIRRIVEAAVRTIPLIAILFLPLLFGLKHVYAWADPARVAASETLRRQSAYLNVPFFLARLVACFLIWWVFAAALSRLSKRQDETADPALERRMQVVAAPGLALYCLTVTVFAIDMLMSLNGRWYSSIWGFYIVGGQTIAGMCFIIVVALFLSLRRPMSGVVQPRHVHDWGNLLLAFTMLWAYFSVSQLIIIWSGDLPEETVFYRVRVDGGWGWVAFALVLLHFAVPFLLLLSRNLKRDLKRLVPVAVVLLALRWVDIVWVVEPAFHPGHFSVSPMDVAAPVALFGVWLYFFVGHLKGRPLLPVGDPNLPAALEVQHG